MDNTFNLFTECITEYKNRYHNHHHFISKEIGITRLIFSISQSNFYCRGKVSNQVVSDSTIVFLCHIVHKKCIAVNKHLFLPSFKNHVS